MLDFVNTNNVRFAVNSVVLVVFSLLISLLSACSKPAKEESLKGSSSIPSDSSQSADRALPKMRLSIDLWPGYYPAVIADQKGWFKEEGLDLVLNMPGNTDKMLARFSAGTIDAIAVAFGDAILVSSQMSDLSVILVTDESAGGDAVLAMDSQVMNNLKGKRIGTNLGGFGELLIRKLLQHHNMSAQDVNLVNVDASKVPHLLSSGKLDLGHTWNPYVGLAKEQGAQVVFSSADTPGLIPDIIAISGEFRRTHPEAVKIFLKVWFKAQQWWLDHFIEGNLLIAESTGQRPENISLDGIRLMSREDNLASFHDSTTEHGLPQVLKSYNDFYIRSGVIRVPAPNDVLVSEFLE
ncbi:ABC transporter substrate-binding protein [Litoribrevibacter albus]|nr:ABC transporter substrate-binding protein [Litoribrevibacter albus]